MESEPTFISVRIPVRDFARSIDFYRALLEVSPSFVDGERYAQFDTSRGRVALIADDEAIVESSAVSVRVSDLQATIAALESAGAVVKAWPEEGPDEVHAVLSDPDGNALVISRPLPVDRDLPFPHR